MGNNNMGTSSSNQLLVMDLDTLNKRRLNEDELSNTSDVGGVGTRTRR